MAITNHERVGKALEALRAGLGPFVEREFKSVYRDQALSQASQYIGEDRINSKRALTDWDVSPLLKLMWDSWNEVFRKILGPAERSLVGELRGHRNEWAHQRTFSGDDTYRALDSAHRLLLAISAPQADELDKAKNELLRLRFDEQVRSEKRKAGGSLIEPTGIGTLKPWREVVAPHKDVASGRYQQAEFAADLWQVHLGEGTDEYKHPVEFFRRTYLTENLKRLLVGAVQRVSGGGGNPVEQLQTNFGGGKTHSMLALYHLFSGTAPKDLAGIESVPKTRRAVLVGNKISPGNPVRKPDGTIVRTLWGELAWQLGFAAGGISEAKKAFACVAADDETATSPGDTLRELMNAYSPCLILIDEWVAYARQLHDGSDLPAGSFGTQFTFAQALSESAKLAKNTLLVISLPASDAGGSPQTQADDVEVGGIRGREALDGLRNVIGRVDSPGRAASAEEGFEIVRRRLFESMVSPTQFKDRDVVARAFADLYRSQHQEFPPECRDADYERRLQAAYPIHPEIFDRLYNDWSTLVRFQRTRGVLRLMATFIHSLWEKADRTPLILPSTIPIDDQRVEFELTRYLSDNWVPVIEKDVDGPNSLPLRIDGEVPNLGKLDACRRVARTIYLGSAPIAEAAHRGIEDRRVKVGCVMPGESPAVFGDALRRLSAAATYLYQDGARYWYSTQATVTKLAEYRAEQLKREPDKVGQKLEHQLREDLRNAGDFSRVHILPHSGGEVPDDYGARLIVLAPEQAYSRDKDSAAELAAKEILESRGTAPRLFRNTLVFLAADKARYQDLDEALRKYLAWDSIVEDVKNETLNLDSFQRQQAANQKQAAAGAVAARLPETYQWLLVPEQPNPQAPVEWHAVRLSGTEPLAVRASKKLRNDELLITNLAASRLRMEFDRIPLWRGDSVATRQVIDDFARYLYLPRVQAPEILASAMVEGIKLLTWSKDSFAYADSFDEKEGRFRGLRYAQMVAISASEPTGLLVKPDIAARQLEAEPPPTLPPDPPPPPPDTPVQQLSKRFHGSVTLNATRVGRDAARIADEVISHLTALVGSEVKVTLEIEAQIPNGVPENTARTVTENSRTLKFNTQGFEKE
jgi:predicted AAA+ superfamily ATPase